MRIAIDIDSTLHHYWDILSRAARARFGVDLPYEQQITWGITLLKPRQVQACVEDTHRDAAILDATPYPDAVETVRAWREAGHFIHITSHRAVSAHGATATWLQEIGLPYDELYCSMDKIARCQRSASTCSSTTARSTSRAPSMPASRWRRSAIRGTATCARTRT